MALRHIYALHDLKSEAFLPPWTAATQGLAFRSLADVVNGAPNPGDPVVTHPEDFELYRIGLFDEQTGAIVAVEKPVLVCSCADLKVHD